MLRATMKIALAQIDTTVGAFADNAAAIVRQAREAADAGAQLVVFPELTLCGYPPKDLLVLREFVQRQLASLDQLAADPVFGRVPALVGFAEPHRGEGAGLFNACALLRDGKIAALARKSLLPTYDVFDEARYFDPSPEVTVVEVAGVRVGLSICEDLWNDKLFWQKPRYTRDPVEELARQGAQVLVNLSASPYALGKTQVRRDMAAAAARRHGMPVALCNLVGGNDSLVFDGHSLAVSARGETLAEAPGFEERLILADLSPKPSPAALTLGIRDYARKTGFRTAVLGLSGGVDSALTAVLAARALGPTNVTAIAMPSRYTASMSNEDATLLAERLGIHFDTIAIEPIFQSYLLALEPIFRGRKPDVTEENLQARIR